MSGFESYNQDTARIPHRGPVGLALAAAIGAEQDTELALLRVALLCRVPQRCPDDALDALGAWYRLPRYPGEPNGTLSTGYRGRLCAAWETWEKAGSAEGVEAQLRAAFGASLDVRCYTDEEFRPFPAGWFSRFVVVIGPNVGSAVVRRWVLGSTALGASPLGGNLNDAARVLMKAIILRWKAAHGYPAGILVRVDSTPLLGLDWTLGVSPLGGTDPFWIWIGRLFGVNWTLGVTPLGDYERT